MLNSSLTIPFPDRCNNLVDYSKVHCSSIAISLVAYPTLNLRSSATLQGASPARTDGVAELQMLESDPAVMEQMQRMQEALARVDRCARGDPAHTCSSPSAQRRQHAV